MTRSSRVRRNGEMLGVFLPDAVIDALRLREGDEVYFVETEKGWTLTREDPGLEEAMRICEIVNQKYADVLQKLADG